MLQKIRFDFKKGQGDYQLLPVEFLEDQIPFEVKRSYFIVVNDHKTQTGQHAHYEEEEIFLLLKGGAELISIDEQGIEYNIKLNPGDAVYVPTMTWHGFKQMEPDTVIVAFSSTNFLEDRSDYLEDKDKFVTRLKV